VKEKSLSKSSQILSLYFLKKISCRQSQCSIKSTNIHLIICILVPLLLAIPVLAGGGGLGALFGNRRQSFLNRVAQQGNNNRPQTFVPTVGESLLLAYIQSASDLYGPMLQG